MRIACPLCDYEPTPADRWACQPGCGTVWNTFETRGCCPGCARHWRQTCCPACLRWSAHDDWYHEEWTDESMAEESEELAGVGG